ncbi:hybrid sensor histidine kinase/response regulator (plasmid) [Phormidium sp. CLA17]|uniref:hybrid sensor histidine kinase/response regulator n=1 Tax=Leptolyngbya sp. Cla-17 TaxID=2803751 RepID=UPI0014927B6E|nr:hybrid sensor histidine kinase/response regulator [Leptolyngbya sp. Cla-17]MBM0745598.1 hybrid sensor histidine kinase/response regulator [Leptolyngbya sp. Cla-17]
MSGQQDFSHLSMLDLFYMEVKNQVATLNTCLLALENNPDPSEELTALMRAAHSIKGAARIVEIDAAIALAHVMEDCFVAAQTGDLSLTANHIDVLLQGSDLLLYIADTLIANPQVPVSKQDDRVQSVLTAISTILNSDSDLSASTDPVSLASSGVAVVAQAELQLFDLDVSSSKPTIEAVITPTTVLVETRPDLPPLQQPLSVNTDLIAQPGSEPTSDRVVRVSVDNLNRLMGLAGESLVEANWLQPFADSLLKLKARQVELAGVLEKLQESFADPAVSQQTEEQLRIARQKASECRQILSDRQTDLELFSRRSANLADRLYREVIASHMRPFGDGGQGFPRMVRDLARQLGKQIKFEIVGKATAVDRDILERLEAPLTHILRNAIDHGIESPAERLAAGKPVQGTIRIEAVHRARMLSITVSDDGRGIDLEVLRQEIVAKQLTTAEMARQLTETELLDFLFLPGFSTAEMLTEVSGRGVGLDVAHSMVRRVGGTIRVTSQPGKGTAFHLQLPLTLSVIRTLLVEISGEPYAVPLTRIEQVVMLPQTAVSVSENRPYFTLNQQPIGLVLAHQVLELPPSPIRPEVLPTIVISNVSSGSTSANDVSRYGLVVDRFLGERSLVVRPLNQRLGKVPNISAAALMEDGAPVLLVDVEDLVRSVDKLLASGQLKQVNQATNGVVTQQRKRILVVDDSITVREMERKLLENKGYEVEVAVNGMDGWNAVRSGQYDLVVTDIDMPRMNGIELVTQIKTNANLKALPVIIVSYKDREEDRIRGLDAGANYYLTKSSFHDDTLLQAVIDLVGEA